MREGDMAGKPRLEVVTFKVDASLMEALKGIPNRSAFIRDSILAALENTCPLCRGVGFLNPDQKRHWESFARNHHVEECGDCHALHLVCGAGDVHGRAAGARH
jgi:hypothetical protein